MPVVVDQAWGAHLGFHPAYPQHALAGRRRRADHQRAQDACPPYSQAAIIAARTERAGRRPARPRLRRRAPPPARPARSSPASTPSRARARRAPLGRERLDRPACTWSPTRAATRLHAGRHARSIRPTSSRAGSTRPSWCCVLDRDDGLAIERALIAAGVPVEQADRDTLVAIVTMLDDEHDGRPAGRRDRSARTTGRAHGRRAATVGVDGARPAARRCHRATAFFAAHEVVPAADAIGRVERRTDRALPAGHPRARARRAHHRGGRSPRCRPRRETGSGSPTPADPALNQLRKS